MGIRRTFTEVVKKRIAASQSWRCSRCDEILESTYQVDHTTPLWAGGPDEPTNATAMCAGCHARKTQEEALRKSRMVREERARRRERFEREVKREEEERRVEKRERDGTATCKDCGGRYYPLFPHACREVQKRCSRRLTGASAAAKNHLGGGILEARDKQREIKTPSTLFEEYFFTGDACRI